MRECPKLDGKHVVFGEVLAGFEVVQRIEKCSVDRDNVVIVQCGELGFSSIKERVLNACQPNGSCLSGNATTASTSITNRVI